MGEVAVRASLDETRKQEAPRWLLPQMLSLDVALVAVAWQVMFARSFHLPLPWAVQVITPCAVWLIYIDDHLLDSHRSESSSPRHQFVRRHQQPLLAIAIALLTVSAISVCWAPFRILVAGACLAAAVLLYLALVHLASQRFRQVWPKEIVVGLVFALGSTIAVWSHSRWNHELPFALALFVGLCILNCSALESAEWQQAHSRPVRPHASTLWVARNFFLLTALLLVGVIAFSWSAAETRLAYALGLAAILQFVAIRSGIGRSPDSMRALADASLLTPLLFLGR